METVKKHMFSIICGGVALLAVLLRFYPLNGWFDAMKDRVEKESVAQFSQIQGATKKQVSFSTLDANNPTVLVFPSQAVLTAAERTVKMLGDEAKELLAKAASLNMTGRTLLVPGSLPAGRNADRTSFKQAYSTYLDELPARLHAQFPVSDAEVTAAMAAQEAAGSTTKPVGALPPPGLSAEAKKKEAEIRDRLTLDQADRILIYLTPNPQNPKAMRSFDRHPGIPAADSNDYPEYADMWAAQLGIWIQQPIFEAIETANKDAKNVKDAVVKRIGLIEIPKEYVTKSGTRTIPTGRSAAAAARGAAGTAGGPSGAGGAAGGSGGASPIKPSATADDPSFRDYTKSVTGRVCNSLYDVMYFTIIVDVDAARYGEFLANLESERFVTILNVDARAIDRDAWQQAGYVYGDGLVVQLVIRCEAIFFRDWTVVGEKDKPGPMPDEVRQLLGIPLLAKLPAAPPRAGRAEAAIKQNIEQQPLGGLCRKQ